MCICYGYGNWYVGIVIEGVMVILCVVGSNVVFWNGVCVNCIFGDIVC